MTTTYRIPAPRMSMLQAQIAKLNKAAHKLGTTPIVLTEHGHEEEPQPDGSIKRFIIVSLDGERPRIPGWTFLATLVHDGEATLIHAVPDAAQPGELVPYRDSDPSCDACQLKRRRLDTFIVRHDDGTLKQVGSSCLRDFLGHAEPEQLIRWVQCWTDADGACRAAGEELDDAPSLWSIGYVLGMTVAAIRLYGWTSRTQEANGEGYSTANTVESAIWDNHKLGCAHGCTTHDHVWPSEADSAEADAALAWARALEITEDTNDYLYNLHAACLGGGVGSRAFGLVCSAVSAYQRQQAKAREAAEQANEYIGKVKERITHQVKVIRIISIPGSYGTSYLCLMEDERGNCLVWKASNLTLEAGRSYLLTGTVKEHDEYKGRKQTHLLRCVGILIEEAAA